MNNDLKQVCGIDIILSDQSNRLIYIYIYKNYRWGTKNEREKKQHKEI